LVSDKLHVCCDYALPSLPYRIGHKEGSTTFYDIVGNSRQTGKDAYYLLYGTPWTVILDDLFNF